MKRIAITGHRPDSFLISHYSLDAIRVISDNIVGALKREYGDGLTLFVGGAVGADQWVADACIASGARFEVVLPMKISLFTSRWEEDERDHLKQQIQRAAGLSIVDLSGKYNVQSYQIRNEKMVDSSDFVIAFWVGQKKGGTYNTIKYALQQKKTVLNALNELKPIFSEDLVTGWTPPTVLGT